MVEVSLELLDPQISIEGVKFPVRDDGIVLEDVLVVPEEFGPAVVISHCPCEDLLLFPEMLRKGSPQEVHGLVL